MRTYGEDKGRRRVSAGEQEEEKLRRGRMWMEKLVKFGNLEKVRDGRKFRVLRFWSLSFNIRSPYIVSHSSRSLLQPLLQLSIHTLRTLPRLDSVHGAVPTTHLRRISLNNPLPSFQETQDLSSTRSR